MTAGGDSGGALTPSSSSAPLRKKQNNRVDADPVILVSPPTKNNVYSTAGDGPVNPWSHRLNLRWWHYPQIAAMSLTLAPLRMAATLTVMFLTWAVARVGLLGLGDASASTSELGSGVGRPLRGWRRGLQEVAYWGNRAFFFCMGVHWVTVKGVQAAPTEAPVLVTAPHATFIDPLIIGMTRSTVVAKHSLANSPFVSSLARFIQVVFVNRGKEDSRKATRDAIDAYSTRVKASSPGEGYRQLLVFPEGTTTNGRALVHFKSGCFRSGVPVQPVLARFAGANRPDTLTWTWGQGYGILGCTWLTMCMINTTVTIEFLPVYEPDARELADERAYARNVRDHMAKWLHVGTVDESVGMTHSGKGFRRTDLQIAAAESKETVVESVEMGNGIAAAGEEEEDETSEPVVENGSGGNGREFDPAKMGYNYVDFAGNLTLVS